MSEDLIEWFEEEDGFSQGTKVPHKWVLQAEQELRRQAEHITKLKIELSETKKEVTDMETRALIAEAENS